jgi:hypothetical protein
LRKIVAIEGQDKLQAGLWPGCGRVVIYVGKGLVRPMALPTPSQHKSLTHVNQSSLLPATSAKTSEKWVHDQKPFWLPSAHQTQYKKG